MACLVGSRVGGARGAGRWRLDGVGLALGRYGGSWWLLRLVCFYGWFETGGVR
jgi:hypothetical protein